MKSIKSILLAALVLLAPFSYAQEAEGEFDNLCVTGLSMGKEVETDCSLNTEVDGKVYCFSGPKAKAMFEKDPDGTIAKAVATFSKLTEE